MNPRIPTAWRGRSPEWCRRAWEDLATWVRWLVTGYSLEGADEGWSRWWTSPGAVEQLVALREWHRELVDVEVVPVLPDDMDAAESSAHELEARQKRLERARDLVVWHDALERVVASVAGRDAFDLVTRTQAHETSTSTRRAGHLERTAASGFAEFLAELTLTGDVAPMPPPGLPSTAGYGDTNHD